MVAPLELAAGQCEAGRVSRHQDPTRVRSLVCVCVCVCVIACKYERGRVWNRVCVNECGRLCMCERESLQSVCRRERPGVHVCVEERVRRCASVYDRRVAGC